MNAAKTTIPPTFTIDGDFLPGNTITVPIPAMTHNKRTAIGGNREPTAGDKDKTIEWPRIMGKFTYASL